MPSPGNALQKAIYQRLDSQLSTPVYDHVLQGSAPPYVVIGADTMTDFSSKTTSGFDCTLTIHAWDYDKAGRKSVKTILSDIYDALHRQEASITVTGFQLLMLDFEFEESFQETAIEGDADGYYHGVQRYRAVLWES